MSLSPILGTVIVKSLPSDTAPAVSDVWARTFMGALSNKAFEQAEKSSVGTVAPQPGGKAQITPFKSDTCDDSALDSVCSRPILTHVRDLQASPRSGQHPFPALPSPMGKYASDRLRLDLRNQAGRLIVTRPFHSGRLRYGWTQAVFSTMKASCLAAMPMPA
jgi:hypothetical protein